jgi:hypothetical protein
MTPSRFSALRGAAVFAACGSLLALAAPAAMASSFVGITGKVTPTKGGTSAKPVGHTLFTEFTTGSSDGTQPPPVRTTVLTYGKQFAINGKTFKSCNKTLLDTMGPTACPKGSQVGAGSAAGVLGTAKLNLPVTAFNAGNGSKLNLYVGGIVSKTIEGSIAGGKGKPTTITFQVPKEVINPVGGTFSSLTRFGVTIKGQAKSGGKTVDYVTTNGCQAGGDSLTAKATYATTAEFPALPQSLKAAVPTQSAATKIACTK